MKAQERNKMLHDLVENYMVEKRNNHIGQAYWILAGACKALEYDIKEFSNCVSIHSKSGRVVMTMFL